MAFMNSEIRDRNHYCDDETIGRAVLRQRLEYNYQRLRLLLLLLLCTAHLAFTLCFGSQIVRAREKMVASSPGPGWGSWLNLQDKVGQPLSDAISPPYMYGTTVMDGMQHQHFTRNGAGPAMSKVIAEIKEGELQGEIGTVEEIDTSGQRLIIRILSNRLVTKRLSEVNLMHPRGVCVMMRLGKHTGRFGLIEGYNQEDGLYSIRFASGDIVRERGVAFQLIPRNLVAQLHYPKTRTLLIWKRLTGTCASVKAACWRRAGEGLRFLDTEIVKPALRAKALCFDTMTDVSSKFGIWWKYTSERLRISADAFRNRVDLLADNMERGADRAAPVVKEFFFWTAMQWIMQGRPPIGKRWVANALRNWILFSIIRMAHSSIPGVREAMGGLAAEVLRPPWALERQALPNIQGRNNSNGQRDADPRRGGGRR